LARSLWQLWFRLGLSSQLGNDVALDLGGALVDLHDFGVAHPLFYGVIADIAVATQKMSQILA
jgi:hypothetical protein